MPGDILLKIAIDLGLETPDFIPSIPTFKNELKVNYTQAHKVFTNALKQVESNPDTAIALSNSALDSIIKEILKDKRFSSDPGKTLSKSIDIILKEFNHDQDHPSELRTLGRNISAACTAIESIRDKKTFTHGKTEDDIIIEDPLYAHFIVNATTTLGLYLISYFKTKFQTQPTEPQDIFYAEDLPF